MGRGNIDIKKYEDLLSKQAQFYDNLSSLWPGGSNKDDSGTALPINPGPMESIPVSKWAIDSDPFVNNLGGIQIIDTNKDGNYDKGEDKIVKRGADGKEIELSLNSKEVKEFKEKYKIDLNSNRQFRFHGAEAQGWNGHKNYYWGGAEGYVRDLDTARGRAAEGDVEGARAALDNAHKYAGEAGLKWDGNLEEGIIKTADQKGVVVAYHRAEAAAANGYVGEANKWLGLANDYATDAAGIDNKKNPDPKLYDAAYAADIGKAAYKKAIEKLLPIAEKMGAVGNEVGYKRIMDQVHGYAQEAGVKIVDPPLNPDSRNYKLAAQYFSSMQFPDTNFKELQFMGLRAEQDAKLGDVGAVDKTLAEAEKFAMENGLRFDEEKALATKSVANENKIANEKLKEFITDLENLKFPSWL